MRFGLAPPNYAQWFQRDDITAICRHAEEVGFDSLWFGDHIALPRSIADIFGNAYLDVFPLLGFVAAVTERVTLGTNVLVVPYRNPLVTAKEAATVDRLSGGRLVLGVGIGHARGEFEALGVPFHERGRRTDEHLRAMRSLWENDTATFSGEWTSFTDLCPLTRPIQDPLPILIGGDGPRSMRRAVEHGAGWAPGQGTMEELAAKIAQLSEIADQAGAARPRIVARWLIHPVRSGEVGPPIRHRGELRRPRLDPSAAADQLARMAELGVDEVIVDIPAHQGSYRRNIDLIADLIGSTRHAVRSDDPSEE
ncbi:LLM class F420-dependent oxidoreductase [Microbacterium sp.]|uniref:LLM class F420-dependent oxidoreductase n=1 Tax=Microbacterium sp. TaxID=51671 RepID=UPI0037C9FD79